MHKNNFRQIYRKTLQIFYFRMKRVLTDLRLHPARPVNISGNAALSIMLSSGGKIRHFFKPNQTKEIESSPQTDAIPFELLPFELLFI